MADKATADQIVTTARELGQAEFTREDIAKKLGVQKRELVKGFREARKSGRIEKVRDDEEGTGIFRVTGN
jgi:DNA-binding transcriptional regulator LsrR (DeoR family)